MSQPGIERQPTNAFRSCRSFASSRMAVTMDGSVPSSYAPLLPARRSLAIKDSSRRRSLPPSANTTIRVNVQPASTEVISSLISSLTVISSPAADHFNTLPNLASTRSTPSSPNPYQLDFPRLPSSGGYGYRSNPASPTQGGFGMDYGAYDSTSEPTGNYFLHPYDVAIAPVVRTSKHPSALSTLAVPKRRSLRRRLRPGSAGSQTSTTSAFAEMGSIGSPSIDPNPEQYAASIASVESGGNRSLRSHRSLVFESSQEREQLAIGTAGDITWGAKVSDLRLGRASASLPTSPLMYDHTTNEGAFWNSSQAPARASFSKRSSQLLGRDATLDEANATPGGIGGGRLIPTRDSSIRHRHGAKSTHRKRRSHKPEEKVSPKETESKTEGRPALDSAPEEVATLPEEEEDEVAKRIKELKELKKMRDYSPVIDTMEPPLGADKPLSQARFRPAAALQSPSKDASVSEEARAAQAGEVEPPNAAGDEAATAPSPAIVQRIDRNSGFRVSSITAKIGPSQIAGRSSASPYEAPQSSPPQRSNSLLRRMARPTGPTVVAEPKRTISKRLSQPTRVPEIEERPTSADSIDDAVDDYLSSPRLTQKIHHPQTGRVISFSDVGDPAGSVVFCCVGMGLTRYITAFYDELAATLKLRLITPDRPGVGESEMYADGSDTPLSWPDDVLAICQHLRINRFSVLAHSAGAIYALATALRMPQHIRGRVHLLAPWIPPSQLSAIGTHQESLPVNSLPYSQRFLRSLPTPFLKAANSNFLGVTSASITTSLPRSPRRNKRKSLNQGSPGPRGADIDGPRPMDASRRDSAFSRSLQINIEADSPLAKAATNPNDPNSNMATKAVVVSQEQEKERQATYDVRLTSAIWDLATKKANPAVDLLVCLERRQTIGFRYVDITRSVVIHHGSKDSRVPVENVKWLGKMMRRCEVRVLDGEGHGLMASAGVMGNVLMEMAQEWEDWMRVVQGKRASEKKVTTRPI